MSQNDGNKQHGKKLLDSKDPYLTDDLKKILKGPLAQDMVRHGISPLSAALWVRNRLY